jgi:hypothetical protein
MEDVMNNELTLDWLKANWKDTPDFHKMVNEAFIELVNADPALKAHRDFTEFNIFGFGERSFLWLHKLLVDAMPGQFRFLEIGVFRGAILSLYRLLADREGKDPLIFGISPMSSAGGHWESDYWADVLRHHHALDIRPDYHILEALSTSPTVIQLTQQLGNIYQGIDILYIDGGHDYATVLSDLTHFSPLVRPGGYMIVDDACNDMHMPAGYFHGIADVTRALLDYKPEQHGYEFLFNVVHNRVYQKI